MKKKMIFSDFSTAGNIGEKNIYNEKKKNLCRIVLGYCPNYIVKKQNLYCKDEIVLQ